MSYSPQPHLRLLPGVQTKTKYDVVDRLTGAAFRPPDDDDDSNNGGGESGVWGCLYS